MKPINSFLRRWNGLVTSKSFGERLLGVLAFLGCLSFMDFVFHTKLDLGAMFFLLSWLILSWAINLLPATSPLSPLKDIWFPVRKSVPARWGAEPQVSSAAYLLTANIALSNSRHKFELKEWLKVLVIWNLLLIGFQVWALALRAEIKSDLMFVYLNFGGSVCITGYYAVRLFRSKA